MKYGLFFISGCLLVYLAMSYTQETLTIIKLEPVEVVLEPLAAVELPDVEPEPLPQKLKISHAQETWIRALEWCESRGNPKAINEVDLDGTPSYASWQFKTNTFANFRKIYGLAEASVMDREAQYELLTLMVADKANINWNQQFPACVAKLGLPPN